MKNWKIAKNDNILYSQQLQRFYLKTCALWFWAKTAITSYFALEQGIVPLRILLSPIITLWLFFKKNFTSICTSEFHFLSFSCRAEQKNWVLSTVSILAAFVIGGPLILGWLRKPSNGWILRRLLFSFCYLCFLPWGLPGQAKLSSSWYAVEVGRLLSVINR